MIAGLNASASGVLYWGWDIAGFSGEIPEADLYLRAFAASAFVPIMQYHSEFSFHRTPSRDRTPWNIAERRGDPSVVGTVRDIVALRERLLPYLSRSARSSIEAGVSLMRPLWFVEPQDPIAWEHQLQWQLGDDIMVAPVVEPGARTWPIYLPRGEWVDAWSGEHVRRRTSRDRRRFQAREAACLRPRSRMVRAAAACSSSRSRLGIGSCLMPHPLPLEPGTLTVRAG